MSEPLAADVGVTGVAPIIAYDTASAHSIFAAPVLTGAMVKEAIPNAVERTLNAWPAFQGAATSVDLDWRFTASGTGAAVRILRYPRGVKMTASAAKRCGWPAGSPLHAIHGEVMLPAVDDLRRVPRATALDWLAYALHEAFHVVYTRRTGNVHAGEFELSPRFEQIATAHNIAMKEVIGLWNAIEDPRIELCAIAHGVARGYATAAVGLVAQHLNVPGAPEQQCENVQQVINACAYAGRAWLPPALRDVAWRAIPARFRPLAEEICGRIEALARVAPWEAHEWERGSGAALEIVAWALEQEVAPPQHEAHRPKEGDGEGEPEEGEGEPQEGEGEPQEGDGEPQEGDGEGEPEEGRGSAPQGGEGNAPPLFDVDVKPTAPLDPTGADCRSPLAMNSGAEARRIRQEAPAERVDAALRNARHQPGAPRVGAALRELLAQTERTEYARGQRSGRLARSALTRAAGGAECVFERRLRFGSDATAVAIALDASGSMQGERMYSAVGACLMILEALRGAHGSESYLYAFHGHHNASMAVAKAWEELVSVGERKLLTLAPSGGTPILTAVAHGINALKTRRAGRRVLLVVTDGDLREWDHLRELSATAKRMGIAVIGVGIGQALGRGFPLCIRVDKLGDLGGSAMALLTQALRREFPVDQAEE